MAAVIAPYIVGQGRAGLAIAKSLALLPVVRPELKFEDITWVPRGVKLTDVVRDPRRSLVFLSNPAGLHARAIEDAAAANVLGIVTEKPSCVRVEEALRLRAVKTPVAVLHVYRQTWGVRTLRSLIAEGELGELVAIEGRYWQASTAVRSLQTTPAAPAWKDDPALSGPSDALLDVGTHWLDAVAFLADSDIVSLRVWRSFVNAPTPHRDSHGHLDITFASGLKAFGSISKTVHGAGNLFEICVIGSRKSARWEFLRPDEILIGEGASTRSLVRASTAFGSTHAAFHGLGWLEGYVDIIGNFVQSFAGDGTEKTLFPYPDLRGNLAVMEPLLRALAAPP